MNRLMNEECPYDITLVHEDKINERLNTNIVLMEHCFHDLDDLLDMVQSGDDANPEEDLRKVEAVFRNPDGTHEEWDTDFCKRVHEQTGLDVKVMYDDPDCRCLEVSRFGLRDISYMHFGLKIFDVGDFSQADINDDDWLDCDIYINVDIQEDGSCPELWCKTAFRRQQKSGRR